MKGSGRKLSNRLYVRNAYVPTSHQEKSLKRVGGKEGEKRNPFLITSRTLKRSAWARNRKIWGGQNSMGLRVEQGCRGNIGGKTS